MNATLIPAVTISMFLVFVVLGFVFGWFRGLSKSLVRIFMVLAVGVLAFFVVPPITKALMTMDISKLNITIGDISAVTLKELISDLLMQIPIVEDLIASSPTVEAFIGLLPEMLLNVVLFILFFFILKWLSMIIYWIIAGVCFSKKKMEGKEKHGFVGALIGAVQGVIVAVIILIPCFGLVEVANPFLASLEQRQEVESAPEQTFNPDVYYASAEETPEGSSENNDSENQIQSVANTISKYTSAFESSWVYKMLDFVKIKDLSVLMFDELSTVSDNKLETSLMGETKVIADALPDILIIMEKGFDVEDNEVLNSLKSAIDKLYASPVLSGVVQEVIPSAARAWNAGSKFCGIAKPELEDAGINALFNGLLINLETSTGDAIKQDIDSTVDVMIIANNAELIKTITENGDIMDVLTKEGNENLIADILSTALKSPSLKAVLPDIINVAMDFVYKALDLDPTTIDDVDVSSSDIADWDAEAQSLQGIFKNLITIYDAITTGVEGVPDGETPNPLDYLDFGALGATLDNMRNSALLSGVSKNVMTAILNSEAINGGSTVLDSFIAELTSDAVWEDKTVSLEKTFVSIGEAVKLAKELTKEDVVITEENIGAILDGLADNDMLKDVVTEVAQPETLEKLGLDETTAGVVSDIVTAVVKSEDIATEVKAVTEVFDLANQIMNKEDSGKIVVEETKAQEIVGALANSDTLLKELSKVTEGGEGGESTTTAVADFIQNNVDTETIENAIGDLENPENPEDAIPQETIDMLKALFGITA